MNDFWCYVILIIGFGCAVCLVNVSFGVYQCSSKAELMQVDYRYQIINGCFIESKGRFVPIGNFREV